MKPMTGLDLLRAVRADAALSETPFIMITAEPTPERVAMGKKAGMDTYITSPSAARR